MATTSSLAPSASASEAMDRQSQPQEEFRNYEVKQRIHDHATIRDTYKRVGLIGKGNFGKIYLARHRDSNATVAIKMIDRRLIRNHEQHRHAINEKTICQALCKQRHDNLVKVMDVHMDRNTIWIVMEYLPNGDLFTRIKALGRLEESEARNVFRHIMGKSKAEVPFVSDGWDIEQYRETKTSSQPRLSFGRYSTTSSPLEYGSLPSSPKPYLYPHKSPVNEHNATDGYIAQRRASLSIPTHTYTLTVPGDEARFNSTSPTLCPEEFDDNPCYRLMRSQFPSIFRKCAIVCIPHSQNMEGIKPDRNFAGEQSLDSFAMQNLRARIETHSFNQSPYFQGQYRSLNGKTIAIEKGCIRELSGFRDPSTIAIISEDWLYDESYRRIRILIVERPLEVSAAMLKISTPSPTFTFPTRRHFAEDLAFLKASDMAHDAVIQMGKLFELNVNEFIDTYVYIRGYAQYAVDKLQQIHTKAVNHLLQEREDFRLACSSSNEKAIFLELVENVIMGLVHEKIYIQSLGPLIASQNSYLAAMSVAYSKDSVTPDAFGLATQLQGISRYSLTSAIDQLSRMDADNSENHSDILLLAEQGGDTPTQSIQRDWPAKTPLEKLECARATLNLIHEAAQAHIWHERQGSLSPSVTTDDLIPLFAYVIAQCRLKKIASMIFYIRTFRLTYIERSEWNFALTTMQAAVRFLKSDPLSIIDASSISSVTTVSSPVSPARSPRPQQSSRYRSSSTSSSVSLQAPSITYTTNVNEHGYSNNRLSFPSQRSNLSSPVFRVTVPSDIDDKDKSTTTTKSTGRQLRHRRSVSADNSVPNKLADVLKPKDPLNDPKASRTTTTSSPTPSSSSIHLDRMRSNSTTPTIHVKPQIVLSNRHSIATAPTWLNEELSELGRRSSTRRRDGLQNDPSSSALANTSSPISIRRQVGHLHPITVTPSAAVDNVHAVGQQTPRALASSPFDHTPQSPTLLDDAARPRVRLGRSDSDASTQSMPIRSHASLPPHSPLPPEIISIQNRLRLASSPVMPRNPLVDQPSYKGHAHHVQDESAMGDFISELQNAQDISSDRQFADTIKSTEVAVLDFWAPWAAPCEQMNDVFAELATKFSTLKFLKIEAEQFPDISESFEIAAVPSFIFVKHGKIVERVEGAKAAELTRSVEKYSKTKVTSANGLKADPSAPAPTNGHVANGKPSPEALNKRLEKLVRSAPVMAFIKGTPAQPRCGFSRQLVQIFADEKVKYSSFNILADDDVRQGLKTFSNWPTFPQVYVNGEFIGGLDIIKELVESGEFKSLLPAEKDLNTRLQEFIEQDVVMAFIKGTPDQPKCGFSKQLVNILQERKVKFGYFDILQDDEVRQGMKTYVNWPTFPMLFYKGELLGGLDIVKEMIESGEFDQVVTA
ncbi:hypothetical protein BZG36_03178 [Bifiguratus adelaidae]|uniref:Thioredoxin domain-containing protein n=1 Tax=Bifiguratus adelaidae TaxID=1938954 RepID=A0A261XYK1_9FUNG|nr:hypothetical protein BZG36_03178 [Bifiguratus adelaidae]